MEKQFQLTNNKEIIAYLAQLFPNCFTLEGEAKPLKIDIFEDILSRLDSNQELSKSKLRLALRSYTTSWRYLHSIKTGKYRIDLNGHDHEVITQEQMDLAQEQLKISKEKAKQRSKKQNKDKTGANVHSSPRSNSLVETAKRMEKQFQLTNSKEIIVYLALQFPKCFSLEGEAKPLKIGIFQDILSRLDGKEKLSKTKLRIALRVYTNNWRYLYCLKTGVHRVDLDGNEGEIITQQQMDYAQQQLKESKGKAKENFKKRTDLKPNLVHSSLQKAPKTLQIGDFVKVSLSNKTLKVQIVNIEKDHIKVKVGSGMQLTVKPEHIIK